MNATTAPALIFAVPADSVQRSEKVPQTEPLPRSEALSRQSILSI